MKRLKNFAATLVLLTSLSSSAAVFAGDMPIGASTIQPPSGSATVAGGTGNTALLAVTVLAALIPVR